MLNGNLVWSLDRTRGGGWNPGPLNALVPDKGRDSRRPEALTPLEKNREGLDSG